MLYLPLPIIDVIYMDEKLIISIVSGLVGAALTYLLAILKLRKELEIKYDIDLRDMRIPEYLKLWKLLEDLAKYPRPKLNVNDMDKLTRSLMEWYFEEGGLFLSENSRDEYFALQEAIKEVLACRCQAPESEIDEPTYEMLREKGSELRTALARDVGTRKAPKFN